MDTNYHERLEQSVWSLGRGPQDPFAGGRWGVRVTAASRLSFTLIDLSGQGGRRNGMASLSLKEPSFEAVVGVADESVIEADRNSSEHTSPIEIFLRSLRQKWNGPHARVRVTRGLPAHNGFGSKTTTLMALGKAYALLCSREADTTELAQVAGRGGTSGASVNLIDRGGFLVDGGHPNPPDFDENPQRYLVPSRVAGSPGRKPPPLINLPFPPWPILVVVGAGVNLHGDAELGWCRQNLPIPVEEARKTAHLILMNMAPAVAEADYEAFCHALNTLTYETYYKQRQLAIQPEPFKRLFAEAAQRHDVDAIGLSVTGPMCFIMTRDPNSVVTWLEGQRMEGTVHAFWFSNAQNHPATIEGVPITPQEQPTGWSPPPTS